LDSNARHPVTTNISDEKMSWHPGHIELSDNADLVLIALTADILAKLAHGFADDALTSIVLATEAPLLLAHAINGKMPNTPRDGCKRRHPQTTQRHFSSARKRAC
jgi:phosphopantothenoylcysteine decarboxylase